MKKMDEMFLIEACKNLIEDYNTEMLHTHLIQHPLYCVKNILFNALQLSFALAVQYDSYAISNELHTVIRDRIIILFYVKMTSNDMQKF